MALDNSIWITPHFRWHEWACHDGTPVPSKYRKNLIDLATELETVRKIWGKPMTILSGYRSPEFNRRVGGAKKSQHLLAKAADIVVAGVSPLDLHTAIEHLISKGALHNGGLGLYRTFVHYDVRDKPARWTGAQGDGQG